jgi:cytochrome c-type biogenesis protein CcmH
MAQRTGCKRAPFRAIGGVMLLWVAFALLTAAVLAAVVAPLARSERLDDAEPAAEAGTLAVYRHQLEEVEAEQARGTLEATEAEAARLEISRRLLASAARSETAVPAADPPRAQSQHATVALATALAVPALALALYLAHGSPGMPSSPFAARTDAAFDQAALAKLISRVEARLREHPDQGKGWEAVAPVYLKLGRFRDAANAYANAARLNGETVALLAGRAEAAIFASDGIVTEEARTAYEKILKLEPKQMEPRFWLAMAKEQDGRLGDALADYQALLAQAPADATFRAPLSKRIEELSERVAAVKGGAPAGPSAADMAAAAKLAPEQRAQMITQMVEGLAQRLKANGRDLAGWLRLVNAYAVLDRKDDARAALTQARRNFADDTGALAELAKLAASLGIGS